MRLVINKVERDLDVPGDMPLLWVLRDELNLTGTKYGCGLGLCGACTVHIDGRPVRACITEAQEVEGREITTIEGIADPVATVVQKVWRELDVIECGYCQSGQIMQAIGLLREQPRPTDDEIDTFMNGNVCRCATYRQIRAAIKKAAEQIGDG